MSSLAQAGREIHAVVSGGGTVTHQHLRERLAVLWSVTLIVDAIGMVVIFLLERHANGTHIHTLGDSAFWTSTQLLTVSSQLPNPLSTGGRIVDVFLQLYAISIVATLAGAFGSFFHRRSLERAGPATPPTYRPLP